MAIKKSHRILLVLVVLSIIACIGSYHRESSASILRGRPIDEGGHWNNYHLNLLHESSHTILNDETIRLSPYVERPWLYFNSDMVSDATKKNMTLPKQKLVLTDFGWSHRYMNGLTFSRSLRSREILQAFVDHENFDPTFRWSREMSKGENATFRPGVHYIVLMDVETCGEANYPYSTASFEPNADKQMGRSATKGNLCNLGGGCHDDVVSSILESPLFLQHPNSTSLMYMDCSCSGISRNYRKFVNPNPNLFVFSYSSRSTQLVTASDMGMPIPASKLVTLSHEQREAIQNCDESDRSYLYTFRGSMRGQVRKDLRDYVHDGNDVLVMPYRKADADAESYSALLCEAIFSGAPRGDCLFSYRFTEVLSSGAIPVIHADGWILPLHPKLIDWSRCVVTIPEGEVNRTVDILKKISADKRCEMRKYCHEIYHKYFVNPEANIRGMVDSIEMAREIGGT